MDGTVSRRSQVAQSLECQAKKFGISPTGDGGRGKPSEGVWRLIYILERLLRL